MKLKGALAGFSSGLIFLFIFAFHINTAQSYYTTLEQNIINRKTGEKVILRGFGLGCWLLPEGYMWGIRKIDRPRQFEKAVIDLIGEKDAAEFWRLYHENFLTKDEINAMKSWGVNSLRVALLASQLQPRENQPDQPPYNYSAEGFRFLDSLVTWCKQYEIGVIWDMHGAPGAQNAENIADSDGEARLWTEKEKYWPMTIELWCKIAERYKDEECIIGYDLLNEPLLRRYEHISPHLLRDLYILLTGAIRTIDPDGIIFVEGDDWAQNFDMLEPLDWDPHLVIAFHSYPPTANQKALQRWDNLRQKYNIPLWHGETGEQGPPWEYNSMAVTFLENANVSWSWWTHKKFDNQTQPWSIPRTPGFIKILDYWRGEGEKPSQEEAKGWLFDQARKTRTEYCEFLPDMVRSLVSLDPDGYMSTMEPIAPEIIQQPVDIKIESGDAAFFTVKARGFPLSYQWMKNGQIIAGANKFRLRAENPELQDDGSIYQVEVSNAKGSVKSNKAQLNVQPFAGPVCSVTPQAPKIDAHIDKIWQNVDALPMDRLILGEKSSPADMSGYFKMLWVEDNLYFLVQITDDIKSNNNNQDHERDGIEIYIDANNSKSEFYEDDEFQFRYNWSEETIYADQGLAGNGILSSQADSEDGYIMEIAFPWNAIHAMPKSGKFVGVEVQANDNDSDRREAKIAWKAVRDNAYRSPAVFGTVLLK